MVKDDVTNAALTLILVAGLWSLGTVMQVVALAAICLFLYTKLLPRLFDTFPGSFTFGEGSVCIQAALISIFECFSSLLLSTDDLSSIEGTVAERRFNCCNYIGVLHLHRKFQHNSQGRLCFMRHTVCLTVGAWLQDLRQHYILHHIRDCDTRWLDDSLPLVPASQGSNIMACANDTLEHGNVQLDFIVDDGCDSGSKHCAATGRKSNH